MRSGYSRAGRIIKSAGFVLVLMAALGFSGCRQSSDSNDENAAYKSYLYMTDTTNGRVYYYNPATHAGSSSSLVTTSSNAAGEIKFYKGIGYVAMGYGGIYYFDPSASTPAAALLPGSSGVCAQYFAFYSATKAYVGTTAGVYIFNPSSLSSNTLSAISATSASYIQEIIVGPDNYIYAADNKNKKVIKINPSTDTFVEITTSAAGTTGLLAGTYKGSSGIFVANTGGYDSSWNAQPGSIDFISTSGTASSVIEASMSPHIYPARMVAPSSGTLIASGYGATYFISLSGTPVVSKTLDFGSFSLSYDSSSGLLYLPVNVWNTSNKLYVFDANGNQQSYSPVSVMTSGDNIAYAAFYQD